jgi:hypothetical protein
MLFLRPLGSKYPWLDLGLRDQQKVAEARFSSAHLAVLPAVEIAAPALVWIALEVITPALAPLLGARVLAEE